MGLLALVGLPTFFTTVALISLSQLILSSFSYISSSAQLSSCTCSPQCLPNCFPWTLVTARPLPTWSHSTLHSPTWTVVSTISSILLSLPPLVWPLVVSFMPTSHCYTVSDCVFYQFCHRLTLRHLTLWASLAWWKQKTLLVGIHKNGEECKGENVAKVGQLVWLTLTIFRESTAIAHSLHVHIHLFQAQYNVLTFAGTSCFLAIITPNIVNGH